MTVNNRLGVREHLISGKPLTELESVVLYGVTSLPQVISLLRKDGFILENRRITYAHAVRRVNEYAVLTPPPNLPVREIYLTEYWVNK